jgi:hypothetical protein
MCKFKRLLNQKISWFVICRPIQTAQVNSLSKQNYIRRDICQLRIDTLTINYLVSNEAL